MYESYNPILSKIYFLGYILLVPVNAVESCWLLKKELMNGIFYPTKEEFRKAISKLILTKRFDLDIIKWLIRKDILHFEQIMVWS